MKAKKLLAAVLAMMLAALACPAAMAEETDFYMVGDMMENFSVALADGTEVSLYGLLVEKRAVLINFWASWCGPCCMEFPYMQAAYTKYADQVGVVALSIEDSDTNEAILQFKADNNLTTLPMGRDNGLSSRFDFDGIPTSVLVDRNGVICMIETGSTDAFEELFALFTSEDYAGPMLLHNGVPTPKYEGEAPDMAALNAVLNLEGGELAFVCDEDEYAWPFMAADGAAVSSNTGVNKTRAVVKTTVNAQAGDVLAFERKVSCEEKYDWLEVFVNGARAKMYTGECDWSTEYVTFKSAGEQTVTFAYYKDDMESGGDDCAMLKNVKLMTGDEAAAIVADLPVYPHALSGSRVELQVIDETAKEVVILDPSGIWAMYYGGIPVYLAPEGTLACKALIGEAVAAEFAALQDGQDNLLVLAEAENDGEGYLLTASLASVADDGYGYNFMSLCSDVYDSSADYEDVLVFCSEEDLNYFTQVVMPASGWNANCGWTYADGTLPSTDECAMPDFGIMIPEGCGLYNVMVTDANGVGIEGVMLQICDDSTCEVIPTDEDGIAQFVKPLYAYEVHVLMVPDVYEKPSETFTLPEEGNMGNAVFITLTTK